MRLNFINDWEYTSFYDTDESVLGGDINNDVDLLAVHVEFNKQYLGFYFVLLGFGVEIVLIHK